jgi:hypothetical protein
MMSENDVVDVDVSSNFSPWRNSKSIQREREGERERERKKI